MSEAKPEKPPLERQKSKDLHVGFNFLGLPEKEEEGKKYLTAKFQRNEMSLIRKRLEVESWIADKLNELYDVSDELLESFEFPVVKSSLFSVSRISGDRFGPSVDH